EATRALLTSTQQALTAAVTEYRTELRQAWDALGRQGAVVESLVSTRINRDVMVDLFLVVLSIYVTGLPLVAYPLDLISRGLTTASISVARWATDRPAPDPSRLLLSEAVQIKRRERDLRLFILATMRSLLVWMGWRRVRQFARTYGIYGPPTGYSYWDMIGQYLNRTSGIGWIVGWREPDSSSVAGRDGTTFGPPDGPDGGGPSDFHEREQRILRTVQGLAERGRHIGDADTSIPLPPLREWDGKGKGKETVRD
ncbi:hypothetical protein HDU93_001162, partial [Gonapodya sp. JEL0774]